MKASIFICLIINNVTIPASFMPKLAITCKFLRGLQELTYFMANCVLAWGLRGRRAWERCPPNMCFETQPFLCAKVNPLLQAVIYSPMHSKPAPTCVHMCSDLLPGELHNAQGAVFMGPKSVRPKRGRAAACVWHGCFT